MDQRRRRRYIEEDEGSFEERDVQEEEPRGAARRERRRWRERRSGPLYEEDEPEPVAEDRPIEPDPPSRSRPRNPSKTHPQRDKQLEPDEAPVPLPSASEEPWPLIAFARGTFSSSSFLNALTSSALDLEPDPSPTHEGAPAARLAQHFSRQRARLDRLVQRAAAQVQHAQSQVQRAEQQHVSLLDQRQERSEALLASFAGVDRRLSAVAHTAVAIGERLDVLHAQQDRAQNAVVLLKALLQLKKGALPSGFRKALAAGSGLSSNTFKCARLAQSLKAVQQHLPGELPLLDQSYAQLQQVLEDAFWTERDPALRQRCARVLLRFDGAPLLSRWVFRALQALPDPRASQAGADRVTLPALRRELQTLLQAATEMLLEQRVEAQTMLPAADAELLLKRLLERVFEDVLGTWMDQARAALQTRSARHHVLLLETLHSELDQLNHTLLQGSGTLPALPSNSALQIQDLRQALLKRCSDSSALPDQQLRMLQDHSQHVLTKFWSIASPPLGDKAPAAERRAALSNVLLNGSSEQLARLDPAGALLRAHLDAAARLARLMAPDHQAVAEAVARVHRAMLQSIGGEYLGRVLEQVLGTLHGDLAESGLFLAAVQRCRQVMRGLASALPLWMEALQGALNTQTLCAQDQQELAGQLETRVLGGLQKLLHWVLTQVQTVLHKLQKKRDYAPDEQDTNLAMQGTPACAKVCELVTQLQAQVVQALRGKNLDQFLTVLGTRLHGVLLEHWAKFTVSSVGALVLLRDVHAYAQMARGFHVPLVEEMFETLQHVVNVCAVPRDSLRAFILDDPKLARYDRKQLQMFLKMRDDAKQLHWVSELS